MAEGIVLGALAPAAGQVLLAISFAVVAVPNGSLRPMRTVVKKLRRKLRDDAGSPAYIFTEARVAAAR